MKVLHFIPDIGVANGVMSVVCNYNKVMPKNVIFDVMYFFEIQENREKEIKSMGGTVYKVCSPGNVLRFRKEIRRFFETHINEYDVVHIHAPYLTVFIEPIVKKYGVRIVVSHCHTNVFSLEKKNDLRNRIMNMPTRYMSDLCIASSDIAGETWFGSGYEIIKNAIDCRQYLFDKNIRIKKRKQLKIENKFVVIQTGKTIVEQKNHRFAFKVLEALLKQKSDSMLILAGGEKTEELDNLAKNLGIEKNIKYLGTRTDIPELLMAADAFILPSTSEGLLIAAIEGQASGLAGIISDRVPDEVCITPNISVMSLETEPIKWAERLMKISNADIKRKMWCQEVIKAGWDIHDNAKQLLKIYGG